MNFISTFDELNKLYESDTQDSIKEANDGRVSNSAPKWWLDRGGTEASWANRDKGDNWTYDDERGEGRRWKESLSEDTDEEIEIVDDESVEEVPAEEPRQVICECDKCGALVIKDEADIVVDEETDLVNVEDECQFCEETKGYKIIGVVAPYDVIEVEDDEIAEAPVEEVPTEDEVPADDETPVEEE